MKPRTTTRAGRTRSFVSRIRKFRTDEAGQVILLSAVMVFVVMIMTIITFDTSKAIYNRIIAQNSVDSAADSAALWQARGCNLLQHLNNLHYNVNKVLYIAETAAIVGCTLSVVTVPAEIGTRALRGTPFAWIWGIAVGAANVSCNVCWTAPWIDWGQEKFSTAVLAAQKVISKVFPALAFVYPNIMAQQCGADNLISGVFHYASGVLSGLGLDLPSAGSLLDAVGDGLASLPMNIYAFPIDPTALSLHVEEKAGDDLPWHWPNWQVTWAKGAVSAAATLCNNDMWVRMAGDIDKNKPEDWGWQEDKYYWGNPGFMTWIACTAQEDELLGLGNLVWLSGSDRSGSPTLNSYANRMFTRNIKSGSDVLEIPAFLAIASSQVEGDPVISEGNANARGHLITVQFPPDDDPTAGEDFLIYH